MDLCPQVQATDPTCWNWEIRNINKKYQFLQILFFLSLMQKQMVSYKFPVSFIMLEEKCQWGWVLVKDNSVLRLWLVASKMCISRAPPLPPPRTLSKWHFRCYQEWNEKCSVIWCRSLLTIRWLNATVILYFQLPMPPNRGCPSGNHSRSAILVTAGGAHFSNMGCWKRNMEVFVKPKFQPEMCSEALF